MEIKVSEKPVGNGTKTLAVSNKGVSCPSSGGEEKSSFSSLLCQVSVGMVLYGGNIIKNVFCLFSLI